MCVIRRASGWVVEHKDCNVPDGADDGNCGRERGAVMIWLPLAKTGHEKSGKTRYALLSVSPVAS